MSDLTQLGPPPPLDDNKQSSKPSSSAAKFPFHIAEVYALGKKKKSKKKEKKTKDNEELEDDDINLTNNKNSVSNNNGIDDIMALRHIPIRNSLPNSTYYNNTTYDPYLATSSGFGASLHNSMNIYNNNPPPAYTSGTFTQPLSPNHINPIRTRSPQHHPAINNFQQFSTHNSSQLPSSSFQLQQHLCEGCGNDVAVIFCVDCDRLMCKFCTQKRHSIRADNDHMRVLINEAHRYRHHCQFHPQYRLTYFCSSCNTPICSECRVTGAHPSPVHDCLTLRDACAVKVSELNSVLQGKVGPRQTALRRQLAEIQAKMDAIHRVKLSIQKETQDDAHGILNRLSAAEARKQSQLQAQMDRIKIDLATLEQAQYTISQLSSDHDMFGFLTSFERYRDECFQLAEKPLDPIADVNPTPLPTETRNRLHMVKRFEELERLVTSKDDMIEKLLKERDQLIREREDQSSELRDVDSTMKEEMQQWIHLTDQFASELKALRMQCRYCHIVLSRHTVNDYCSKQRSKMTENDRHFFDPIPEEVNRKPKRSSSMKFR